MLISGRAYAQSAPNQPPELAPVGTPMAFVGVPLRIALSATDPERGALTFSVAGAPQDMVLTDHGNGTAEVNWLPAPDQVDNYSLTFSVTDDGMPPQSDSETIMLSVGLVNHPPVLEPIGNRGYDAGEILTIDMAASDSDGDLVAYSVIGAPEESELEDFGDGTGRWSWTPPAADASYELTFVVTDSGFPAESVSETVVLSPNRTNQPPVLAPIGNRRVRAGAALLVSISASDPDDDALAFSARGVPDGASFTDLGGGAAELRWTPSAAQVGTFSVVVAVADAGDPAEVASEAFDIEVEPAPVEPEGELQIDFAVWNAWARSLFVMGSGAAPRETVSLVDARTGTLLGVTRAGRRGRFFLAVAPALAPCAVTARVLAGESAPHAVAHAPANCGQRLLTHVHELKWSCESSELRVKAHRVPASGSLDVHDASSGALLGSVPADHHGEAKGRLKLDRAPQRVRLTARSGQTSWDLGSRDVDDCRRMCRARPVPEPVRRKIRAMR
jgi:hypothetical protein